MPHPIFTPAEVELLKSTNYILTDKDHAQLSTPDDQFTRLSWHSVNMLIHENRLEELKRVPSDLRRYILWCERIRRDYEGGVMGFMLQERLCWGRRKTDGVDRVGSSVIPSEKGELFKVEDDVKILLNDWPYGLAPDITHLVIWTKTIIPIDGDGHLTLESRRQINEFVQKVFGSILGMENVTWAKNPRALQSIPSLEHVHVFVREVREGVLTKLLEGPWGTQGEKVRKLNYREKQAGEGL